MTTDTYRRPKGLDDNAHVFLVTYRCPCGNEWQDAWDSACDDDCGACGRTVSAASYIDDPDCDCPACVGELTFLAPDGKPLQGLMQESFGSWPVIWINPADAGAIEDFTGAGPDGDFDTVRQLDGDDVWLDVDGFAWLTRHLIRNTREPLSVDACAAMQAEVCCWQAHQHATDALKAIPDDLAALTGLDAVVPRLLAAAELQREHVKVFL